MNPETQIGPEWAVIAQSLDGRSRNNVKNRFLLIQSRLCKTTPDAQLDDTAS
jgi:hypothetical protein